MNTYGEIVNNICVNLVVADEQWVSQQTDIFILSTPDNLAYIGATVIEGIFTPPLVIPQELG